MFKSKLVDLESSFDFDGMDKMVFNMCMQDLTIYAQYIKEEQNKVLVRCNQNTIRIDSFSVDTLLDKLINSDLNNQDSIDDKKSVEAWVEWWYSIYKKRVKLTFTQPKVENSTKYSFNKLSNVEIDEIKKMMKFSMIEKGVICGTTIIIDSLFKKILSGYSDKFDWGMDKKINLLNVMLRETRRLCNFKGTLIFIRPTKEYYLTEYRNSGSTPPVSI
jgi:hypothetical protein